MLAYGLEAVPMTESGQAALDISHRKLLRSTLGVRYPTILSNTELAARTKVPLFSKTLRRRRLMLPQGELKRCYSSTSDPSAEPYYGTSSTWSGKDRHPGIDYDRRPPPNRPLPKGSRSWRLCDVSQPYVRCLVVSVCYEWINKNTARNRRNFFWRRPTQVQWATR